MTRAEQRTEIGRLFKAYSSGDASGRSGLFARSLEAHETDGAKDRPLRPGTVMLAPDCPGHAGVTIRVAAVHLVAVVQIQRDLKGRLGVGTPFQDLLGPIDMAGVILAR